MKFTRLAIPDVVLIEPKLLGDDRGFFYESFKAPTFAEEIGVDPVFVQDNHSRSAKNVLRGLHYQLAPCEMGKLVRVTSGAVFDVAVDIRPESPTYGEWVGATLSADNLHQLWVPPGFAHGFVALTDHADFLYKVTHVYSGAHDRSLRWNDPTVGVDWPLDGPPRLSQKDTVSPLWDEAMQEILEVEKRAA